MKNASKSVLIEGKAKVNFNGSAEKLARKVKRNKVPMEYEVTSKLNRENKASRLSKQRFNAEQRTKLANTAIKSGALAASAAGLSSALSKAFMPSNGIFGKDGDGDDR